MKNLFLIFLLASCISSCAFKDEDILASSSEELLNRHVMINPTDDLDFDGMSNEDEQRLGTDPYIADIPEVRIRQIKEVKTGIRVKSEFDGHSSSKFLGLQQEYVDPKDSESKESLIRRKTLNLQYIKITDPTRLPDQDEMATLSDYDLFIIGRWKDRNFYPFQFEVTKEGQELVPESGRITSVFKVELQNLLGVSYIERVFLSTNLIDFKDEVISEFRTHPLIKSNNTEERYVFKNVSELKPQDNYFLYDISLDTSSISDLLVSRNNIALKIKNFTFNRLGKDIDFAQLVSQVEEKTARVIFSTNKTTKTYQVAPGMTVESFLKHIGHEVVSDKNGFIISIDETSNSLSTPVDIENIPVNELDNGLWHILGQAETLKDTLIANKQYIVSYASAREIIESQDTITPILENYLLGDNGVEVNDVRIGDKFEVSINGDRLVPFAEKYNAPAACNCIFSEVYLCGGVRNRDDCYRDVRKNTYCTTTFTRVGYYPTTFNFTSENTPLHIRFPKGLMTPSEIVTEEDGVAVYDDRKQSSFRFSITQDQVGEDRFFFMSLRPLSETEKVLVGFHSVHDSSGGRSCYSLNQSASNQIVPHKSRLNINLFRSGINR